MVCRKKSVGLYYYYVLYTQHVKKCGLFLLLTQTLNELYPSHHFLTIFAVVENWQHCMKAHGHGNRHVYARLYK